MKNVRLFTWIITALLLTFASLGNAWADRRHHHGHSRFELYVGPSWGPLFYPSPYYYPPSPPIIIERAPPVYIEQTPPRQTAAPAGYWYFCSGANAYYPYVRECPSGWQRVAPSPADQP